MFSCIFPRDDREHTNRRLLLLARCSVLFFLAVLPFPHNAALKNIGLALMLGAVCWAWKKNQLNTNWKSPVLISLFGLIGTFVLISLASFEAASSLDELRKHFLPGVLLLILVPAFFKDKAAIACLISTICTAITLRSGLVLWEIYDLDSVNGAREAGLFTKGFAMESVTYWPILLAAFFFTRGRFRFVAAMALTLVGTGVWIYASRAPLIAIVISTLCLLLLLRKWKTITLVGGAAVLAGSILFTLSPELTKRYASIFQTSSYQGAEGMSARAPIWKGVIEIGMTHPMIGQGFGWKKMGRIAVEQGFVQRWQEKKGDPYADLAAWYFSLPTEKVNPHNLFLQIFFEGGYLGLLAYAITLLILIYQSLQLTGKADAEWKILPAVCAAYLAGHIVLGFANGIWLGTGPSFLIIAFLEIVRNAPCLQQRRYLT